ncbi:MAG: cytochrome c oxidase subunit 3 [Acidobacteriia bacterium]|nr:cytochrome c oxidase subunit 3 [Terriglobia bacterium]
MWVFLATEIMFFGGLFAGYSVYRGLYFPGFDAGSALLNVKVGALNTALLLCSSLTMALGVRAATLGKRRELATFLVLTILLGLTFVGIKLGVEWHHDYLEHLAPGINFAYEGPNARAVELFFVFYFFMTGVHALHMVVGVSILAVLLWMTFRGRFGPERYNPVEMAGLYWHFVDIIWIFLYPLLYLIGAHH